MSADEQGVSKDRYKLIPRTLTFLTRRDHVLLLRGSSKKRLWANKYNGVGGHIEQGENILEAARREIIEETGLIPDDLWLCGILTINTGLNTGIGLFIFRGECSNGEAKKSEEGDLTWINQNQYRDLLLVEDLHQLLPRILAMRKHAPPFFAHTDYEISSKMIVTFAD